MEYEFKSNLNKTNRLNMTELALKLDISRRSLYRYLSELREKGRIKFDSKVIGYIKEDYEPENDAWGVI